LYQAGRRTRTGQGYHLHQVSLPSPLDTEVEGHPHWPFSALARMSSVRLPARDMVLVVVG
jgi:hypothetical protein